MTPPLAGSINSPSRHLRTSTPVARASGETLRQPDVLGSLLLALTVFIHEFEFVLPKRRYLRSAALVVALAANTPRMGGHKARPLRVHSLCIRRPRRAEHANREFAPRAGTPLV